MAQSFSPMTWKYGALTLAVAAVMGLPSLSTSGIEGSAHDFSALDSSQQICIFCHTAHNGDTTVADAPLWNHAVTQKNYTVYSSPTMQASPGQPSGSSKLCLSCHDGTVAVDSYGGRTGVIFLAGDLAVGHDELTNDHPIGFAYTDQLASDDGELWAPSSHNSGLGSTIQEDMLFNNSLECASCHDVHNGGAAAAVNDSLLVITQQGSQLCLTCHNK